MDEKNKAKSILVYSMISLGNSHPSRGKKRKTDNKKQSTTKTKNGQKCTDGKMKK